ncbi:MAG: hypothetical protein K2X50_07240 [Gammaproteobacteria bacterium]|nr:hypothetical protein [Gammaproteobacteria bacterium]
MGDLRDDRRPHLEDALARERQEIKHEMQFNLFFVALIFTTLSLSVQFALKIPLASFFHWVQVTSWVLLLRAGVSQLVVSKIMGGPLEFSNRKIYELFVRLFQLKEEWIWIHFIMALIFLMIPRVFL